MALPWLYEHRTNVVSQHGEDGVLQAIFEKIGVENRWCVDIGAGNGLFISNSWNLVEKLGWSALLVEGDANNAAKLKQRYAHRQDVYCFNEMVTLNNHPDAILSRTPIPKRFDFLSIDIDGMDYKIWERMTEYRPRVVVIEINASMDSDIFLVQQSPEQNFGSSFLAMVQLAQSKGYELVAHLVSNCVFVLREEFGKLGIEDNSPQSLFLSPFIPKIISDMKGVHYLLKEGPWGFSGVVYANYLRPREDGVLAARRIEQFSNDSGGGAMPVCPTSEFGFYAVVVQNPNLLEAAKNFISRTVAALKDL